MTNAENTVRQLARAERAASPRWLAKQGDSIPYLVLGDNLAGVVYAPSAEDASELWCRDYDVTLGTQDHDVQAFDPAVGRWVHRRVTVGVPATIGEIISYRHHGWRSDSAFEARVAEIAARHHVDLSREVEGLVLAVDDDMSDELMAKRLDRDVWESILGIEETIEGEKS